MEIIKSISYNQEEIIESILSLYSPEGIDVDPTYSKGNFYKGRIKEPMYKFDINPKSDSIIKACATNLPLEDQSVNCIMFDPPFLATTGKSLTKNDDSNTINKRFGVFPNEIELHQFYKDALGEFFRISKKNGILIFKCQDKVSSGKQYFSHCYIYEKAREIGWYPQDLFVLLAKNRLVANWQRNQKHCRKYHSYFWVFRKKQVNICV
tara:strand:+ start:1013 stop:1636 length:624 start_codon:yes stop_codon:yes gene_type:complete